MHSHHSHSGEYVAHASQTLEEVIEQALYLQFETFCLTEHMPRYDISHLYPEELERNYTSHSLEDNFEKYYEHATRIKTRLNNDPKCKTKILVGFETEGGLSEKYLNKALEIRKEKKIDLVVGSVHHINEIPLDYGKELWLEAKKTCNDDMQEFFKAYFDRQYDLLVALHPEVVGHFDLIRLMLDESDVDANGIKYTSEGYIKQYWPKVWEQIITNIKYINSYGGLIELNSAAIRKGWDSPYPKLDIVKAVLENGGRFCLSDDSHGTKQVGLNYFKVIEFCESSGITELSYWDLDSRGKIYSRTISIKEAKRHPFWVQLAKLS